MPSLRSSLAPAVASACLFALTNEAASRNITLGDDQTSVTKSLNALMAKSDAGIYKGGHGVLVRAIDDGVSSAVVPASLLVNDINPPSTMYPDGNPFCPNKGSSGYNQVQQCDDDPWMRATVGAVIGTNLPQIFSNGDKIQDDDWGYGVFYGTDSNSADMRCRWVSQYNGYDCPGGWIDWGKGFVENDGKKGAGAYPSGNPNANLGGGGAGCHFNMYDKGIDQFDAINSQNQNLVGNQWCECNYDLKGNWWQDWVNQWIDFGKAKPGYEWMGWFGKGKAPSFGADMTACWVNNPRDMIMIQNAMWWFKDKWNNFLVPQGHQFDEGNIANNRRYWGWNEIPVDNNKVNGPANWDAVVIKLPAAICGDDGKNDKVDCLSQDAKSKVEQNIDWYVTNNLLKPGEDNLANRPGSSVVFLREYYVGNKAFERSFYCENWSTPSGKYNFVLGSKGCYIDHGMPGPTPPPPPPSTGGVIRYKAKSMKCMDVAGGSSAAGAKIQIWDCNNLNNQNWLYRDGSIRSAMDTNKCVDLGAIKHGSPVTLENCNGQDSQRLRYSYRWSVWHTPDGVHCVDLINGDTTNGNTIQSWFCNAHQSQQWTPAPAGLLGDAASSSEVEVQV